MSHGRLAGRGEVVSVDGGATATNTRRPSGGAGAWDPGVVDPRGTPRVPVSAGNDNDNDEAQGQPRQT
jgi:hypothetical protein